MILLLCVMTLLLKNKLSSDEGLTGMLFVVGFIELILEVMVFARWIHG